MLKAIVFFINEKKNDLIKTCSILLIFILTNVKNSNVKLKYAQTSHTQNDRNDSTSRILTLSLYKIKS